MAGEIRMNGNSGGIPKPTRKSRKLWSLQDRSVVSVNLLKANLAEEGCEEAQLDVAKKLLADADPAKDSSSPGSQGRGDGDSSRLAVYWFIKSSEQGNDEATQYLKECYESGRGITCQNVLDVKTCISTPKSEKLSFKAARNLYSKLSNGEEFITTAQLLARLESRQYETRVTFEKTCSDQDEPTLTPDLQGIEQVFLNSEEDDMHSCISSVDSEYLSSRTKSGFKLTLDDLLKVAASFNEGEIPSVPIQKSSNMLSTHEWNLVSPLTAFIFQFILLAVPCKLFEPNFGIFLVIATLNVYSAYNLILWKARYRIFKDWSDVFKSVSKENAWNDKNQLLKFRNKYLRPYIVTNFFCFLLLFTSDQHPLLIVALALVSITGLNTGGLTSVHLFLTFAQLLLAAAVLDSIPLVRSSGSLMKYVGTISYASSRNYIFSSLWIGIIALVLLAYYILKCRRDEQTQTEVFFKALEVIWVLKIIDSILKLNTAEDYFIFIGLTVALFILYFAFESKLDIKKAGICCGIMLALIAISFHRLSILQSQAETKKNIPNLNWVEYEMNCHRSAWRLTSVAETQMSCRARYEGRSVKWIGKLSYVQLRDSVDRNSDEGEIVFEMLMDIGDKQSLVNSEWAWQDILPFLFDKNRENQLALAPVALLISVNQFNKTHRTNLTRHILNFRAGDVIEFSGILKKNIGGFKPEIQRVESLHCISCLEEMSSCIRFKPERWNFLDELKPYYADFQLRVLNWW